MRVAIVYNQPLQSLGTDAEVPDIGCSDPEATADADVLAQVAHVAALLSQLGHQPIPLAATLNLEALRTELAAVTPELVFNLVESLGATDRLQALAPLVYEALDYSYTGNSAMALLALVDKCAVKAKLQCAAVPTPDWVDVRHSTQIGCYESGRFVIKSIFEHGSFQLEDSSLGHATDATELAAALAQAQQRSTAALFAERYIEGREFNVSLLAADDADSAVQVLPIAEIDFSAFPSHKPRIVSAAAKWNVDSFDFSNTPRRFIDAQQEQRLYEQLESAARQVWSLFGLNGFARVDFRVDTAGRLWVIDVNANPCLSPDAGFMAAVAHANMTAADAMRAIIKAAVPAWRAGEC